MTKAIIFDLDNTLMDFMKMKHMAIEAAASAMIDAGLEMKKEKIVKTLFELYTEYGLEDKTVFQKFLYEDGHIDYRILASAINAYRRVRSGFLEPFPHVVETLIKLKEKGVKIAIVSDAPRLKAWLRITAMGIVHYLDVVVTFDDTKKLKPSKKPFLVALRKLGVAASECFMVGDLPERDIQGAKKLGMKTVFARYGNPKAAKTDADFEINDVKELIKII